MSLYASEADAEWLADRLQRRLQLVRDQRPARLRDRGELAADIVAWGKRLVDGEAGNLILVGPTGSGKSWAAWEVLERAVAAGYAGRIVFASSADWRETIAPPPDRDRLRRMAEADVLVLDDLGSARIGEWEKECLLGVVDERWSHDRPIVITSNLPSLREAMGERIASRLADGAMTITVTGADRRRAR